MEMALTNIWGNPPGFKVIKIEKHTFQLFFDREEDMERVLKGGAWLYRNSWLLLQSINLGKKLGETLGTVIDTGLFEIPENDNIIVKAKVCMKMTNPIKRDANIGNRADGIHWIDFKYEKLPQFCYGCGRIGHDENQCDFGEGLKDEQVSSGSNYGPWLRASQFGKRLDAQRDQLLIQEGYSQPRGSLKGVNKVLSSINVSNQLPWLVIGDFNEVLHQSEHLSATPRSDQAIHLFRSVVDECNLVDLGYNGSEFTWCNNRDPPHTVYVRLDCCMANLEWKDLFLNHRLEHLTAGSSDHVPILLRLNAPNRVAESLQYSRRPFRFEKMWMSHDDCAKIVKDTWSEDGNDRGVVQSLQAMAERFGVWNKSTFGHVGRKIKDLQKKISFYFSASGQVENRALKSLQNQLDANPSSLCAQVLKARYFPTESFLKAKLGYNPSLTWRSIIAGRQALELGISRRIGDGQTSLVFKDNWIPNVKPPEVVSNLCVFPPNIANNILSIPLPKTPKDDSWFWSLTPNGHYSVKSGYRELRRGKIGNIHDTNFHQFSEVWKKLWKLQIPAKIKFFLWRVCKGILPVCSNLAKRGMDVAPCCPVCSSEEESICHATLFCSQIRALWSSLPLSFVGEYDEDLNFIEWFNMALTQWDVKDLCLFAIAAYKVWDRRNEIRLGSNPPPLSLLKDSILSLWGKVDGLHEGVLRQQRFPGRDSSWVLGALAKRAQPCASMELLEAEAVLAGVEFVRDLRCLDLEVEGDAQRVFPLLNGQPSPLSCQKLSPSKEDPWPPDRSLGTVVSLHQISQCRRLVVADLARENAEVLRESEREAASAAAEEEVFGLEVSEGNLLLYSV
ncbi:putative ribonuclease H-like domain, reverse transcriptase zinc-binding domain-containing protein [Senna tora]|uniref:Putative ribonuclease H-like domain, reverse transcriptase zinc-binding domain-containing protein n=1 Tax=Senna tora TaxID=362788 RepID=A0A835C4E7_9FABA|nr:putative ribonuclease H-like domain, reverse transcriptase zinc-binding domain-containing protein [Senna tora]